MDEKKVIKQMSYIDKLNKKYQGKIKILKGIELNILKMAELIFLIKFWKNLILLELVFTAILK